MSILVWIIVGLVVGVIAKLILPGRQPGGIFVTTLLGMAGALLAGFLGRALGMYPSTQARGGFIMSLLGALVVVGIYSAVVARRSRLNP
jgi:uncharacterized membrane protein YeaQ/YmgE (transglycosylase-associated protein family)